jgi:hypothetical protein
MLRSEDWSLVTDVSRQPVSSILKGQAVQEEDFKLLKVLYNYFVKTCNEFARNITPTFALGNKRTV